MGHANVIRHCGRPFADADEMDAALIKNWNDRVHRNDTVYIVGDLLFRAKRPAEECLSILKGRKHLLIGNHDKFWMKKVDLTKWFESIAPMLSVTDNGRSATLCHYPLMTLARYKQGQLYDLCPYPQQHQRGLLAVDPY